MRLLDALKQVMLAAGTKADDAELAKLLADPELAAKEISDEKGEALAKLMGLEAAKANPDLAAYHKAITLNGFDTQFIREAKAAGYDDTQIAEWTKDGVTTGKRFELLLAKMQADSKEAIKAGKGQTDETKVLNQQISDMQNKLTAETKAMQEQLAAKDQTFSAKQKEWKLQEMLSALPRNPAITPENFKYSALPMLLDALAAEGAMISDKNGVLELVQVANEEQPFIKNNVKVDFNNLAKEILLKGGLVAATNGNEVKKGNDIVVDNQTKPAGYGGEYSSKSVIQQGIDAARADLASP